MPLQDTYMLGQNLDGSKESQIPMPIIQRTRIQTNAAGVYTWTYPIAFNNPPIVSLTPEDGTVGASVDVKLTAAPTATSCAIQVNKVSNVLGILTLAAVPGATYVHIVATAA